MTKSAALALCGALVVVGATPTTAGDGRATIGHSVRGRPLVIERVGPRDAEHQVLVVGCIHGNECAGIAILNRLRRMRLPASVALWLIDELNPDGVRAGTRQNARGVDLNRNFPYRWRAGGEPWDTYYPGPRPSSEPETRAIKRFVINRVPDVTIWFHQAMALIVRSRGDLDLLRAYSRAVGLPLRDIGKLPGTAVRWQNHRFRRKTAFVVELPGGALSDRAALRHARAVLEVAGMSR